MIKTEALSADAVRRLGGMPDELLPESGQVVQVTCMLKEDPGTASGHWWSTGKNADIAVTKGMLVDMQIVLEEKAPIAMLFSR